MMEAKLRLKATSYPILAEALLGARMLIISHPTGNANVRAAVHALAEHKMLRRFFTTLSWNPRNSLSRIIPGSIRNELERRTFEGVPQDLLVSRPRREVLRHVFSKLKMHSFCVGEDANFSVDAIYRDLDQFVSSQLDRFHDVDKVYAYEDGALSTFESAKSLGMQRIYDLPIGYWRASRKLAEEEAMLSPQWAATLTALTDSPRKYRRKDRELELADKIIVASEFTKASLASFPENLDGKIFVVPYGVPVPVTDRKPISLPGTPLRVLYVGALSQRKGLSYLAEAMRLVGKSASLTMIGQPTMPTPQIVKAMCEAHHWIRSLPHDEILKEMSRHDVLVFPSLFEGFGLVITEALSRGLPVITTPNTGGPDVLRHGVDGFIVPIRSPETIADCLFQLIENRDLLEEMSKAALGRAADLGWQQYRKKLISVINE